MDDAGVLPARHRVDVQDYHRMGEAGIFGDNRRIELIDGDVIDMVPIGQGHAATTTGLNEALVLACSGRAIVSVGNPVRLDRWNEPQPDFAVLRRRADFYATGERPGPGDVLLLIEVSDSSLRFDRTVKLPLYARFDVPEVWIVDMNRRVLEACREPRVDGYGTMTTHAAGEQIGLVALPDITVRLELMFG